VDRKVCAYETPANKTARSSLGERAAMSDEDQRFETELRVLPMTLSLSLT
jgi:hypothetical protein